MSVCLLALTMLDSIVFVIVTAVRTGSINIPPRSRRL
ncbi:hypothetical protein RDABS01_003960 [Bienertia sinuspersici]